MTLESGALAGIRVLDLTQMIAGPYCTQLLADLGAEVIKIEEPAVAPGRRVGRSPRVTGANGEPTSFSAYWLDTNRNKLAVNLDLRSKEGRGILADLVRVAHVVVENFSAHARETIGISESWGLNLNAALVWASLTAFGRTGPDSNRDGWDILAQARGGLMSITGEPDRYPMKTGNSLVDYLGGLHLAVAILAAVRHSERTGQGQLVDISLLESLVACLDGLPLWSTIAGVVPQRSGNYHPMHFPGYSVFAGSDGYVAIGATPGPIWARLAKAIDRPDLISEPDIADAPAWQPFFEDATKVVATWTAQRSIHQVQQVLDAARVPNEPVRDLGDIWTDPQLHAREMFIEYDYLPLGRRVSAIGSPLHLTATPAQFRSAPPTPGEHTWHVLRDVLGYDEDRIAELTVQSVVQ